MITIGSLCKTKDHILYDHNNLLCEVISTYNKRDIDYECPESIAIIPMVKAVYLSGENQGKQFCVSRKAFSHRWEVVNDT